jgi:polysaccharide pyruvyl transferase WcaK-like protein
MNIKHVGILNAYDARNRGDRAIVEAQLGWIERTMPGASVTIFSPHHEFNRSIFGESSSMEPLFSVPKTSGALGRLLRPPLDLLLHVVGARKDDRAKAFQACEAYFVCGGGYLYSSTAPVLSRQLWLHAANILAALRTGKPVLSFPQSWGPLRKSTDRWICHKLAAALPVIVTRGRQSDDLLSSWGFGEKIVSLPDVVVAAADLIPEVKTWRFSPRNKGSLGIAPIDWNFARKVDEDGLAGYIAKLVEISRSWCEAPGRSVTVFPQVEVEGSDDDGIIARRLVDALTEAGIKASFAEGLEWDDYWNRIAAQEVFIGCRMHSCIFALVCGVPTIGLGYQPKFAELFEQLGWAERTYLIDRFIPSDVSQQLQLLANEEERNEVAKTIDSAGAKVVAALDKAWRETLQNRFHSGSSRLP